MTLLPPPDGLPIHEQTLTDGTFRQLDAGRLRAYRSVFYKVTSEPGGVRMTTNINIDNSRLSAGERRYDVFDAG